jgi:hypothetical protein
MDNQLEVAAQAPPAQTDAGPHSVPSAEPGLGMDESGWQTLVDSILSSECTPVLGAGVALPDLPDGGELAKWLAQKFEYPLKDNWNLPRVAQFIATKHQDRPFAKRQVAKRLREFEEKALSAGKIPDNFLKLASLGLPLYITTNYDDFMARALLSRLGRKPQVEIARWSNQLREAHGGYSRETPAGESPWVFHLHGALTDPSSILVTDDDYIDFMVMVAQDSNNKTAKIPLLNHHVRRALANSNLLFIGYSLNDWNFRVMMRHLMKQANIARTDQYRSISIQMPPDPELISESNREAAKQFLADYLSTSAIEILWCTAKQFLDALDRRVMAAKAA